MKVRQRLQRHHAISRAVDLHPTFAVAYHYAVSVVTEILDWKPETQPFAEMMP